MPSGACLTFLVLLRSITGVYTACPVYISVFCAMQSSAAELSTLRVHFRTAHPDERPIYYHCGICRKKAFEHRQQRIQHEASCQLNIENRDPLTLRPRFSPPPFPEPLSDGAGEEVEHLDHLSALRFVQGDAVHFVAGLVRVETELIRCDAGCDARVTGLDAN